VPYVPNLMTDFFASESAGHAIACHSAHTAHHGAPSAACKAGADAAVRWASWASFVSNTCLVFFLSPLTGTWSDTVGRVPFLLAGQVFSLLPYLVLLLHQLAGLTLTLYYPAQARRPPRARLGAVSSWGALPVFCPAQRRSRCHMNCCLPASSVASIMACMRGVGSWCHSSEFVS
jgi:MFS family permease